LYKEQKFYLKENQKKRKKKIIQEKGQNSRARKKIGKNDKRNYEILIEL